MPGHVDAWTQGESAPTEWISAMTDTMVGQELALAAIRSYHHADNPSAWPCERPILLCDLMSARGF